MNWITGLVAAISVAAGDVAQTDKVLLQGTWSVVSVESALRARPKGDLDSERLVVTDDRWHIKGGHKEGGPLRFKIDQGKSPSHIDLLYTQGGKQFRYRGIYWLDGDSLTAAVHYGDKGRPTEFKPGADT